MVKKGMWQRRVDIEADLAVKRTKVKAVSPFAHGSNPFINVLNILVLDLEKVDVLLSLRVCTHL